MAVDNSEKALEKACIEYIRQKGYYCQKIHSGKMFKAAYPGSTKTYAINLADEGTPDIFCCIDGIFVAIEVKKDEGVREEWYRQYDRYKKKGTYAQRARRSIMQHLEQDKIRDGRGIVCTVTSLTELEEDIEEVLRITERARNFLPNFKE